MQLLVEQVGRLFRVPGVMRRRHQDAVPVAVVLDVRDRGLPVGLRRRRVLPPASTKERAARAGRRVVKGEARALARVGAQRDARVENRAGGTRRFPARAARGRAACGPAAAADQHAGVHVVPELMRAVLGQLRELGLVRRVLRDRHPVAAAQRRVLPRPLGLPVARLQPWMPRRVLQRLEQLPVKLLQNTLFQIERAALAQLRPGSSFLRQCFAIS